MIKTLDDLLNAYNNCECSGCKTCSLNAFVDIIPAKYNEGESFRASICDVIVHMNNYYRGILEMVLK